MMTQADFARIQGLFDPERVYRNRQPTLAEIDEAIVATSREIAELLDIRDEIAASLPKPGVRLDRFSREAATDARNDLTFLTNGFTRAMPVTNLRLRERAGLPGLAACDRLKVRLDKLREKEAARLAVVWPRAFRYTGRPGDAEFAGRVLEPGDIVELTEGQARSFADRFEPVAS